MFKILKRFIQLRKLRRQRKKGAPMGASFFIDKKDLSTEILDKDLIDKNLSKKEKKKIMQFTKIIVSIITLMTCVWISFSYYLAWYAVKTFQDTETLEELSKQVCVTILGVVTVYATKAFFESWSEGKQKLAEANLTIPTETLDNTGFDISQFN